MVLQCCCRVVHMLAKVGMMTRVLKRLQGGGGGQGGPHAQSKPHSKSRKD